mmetsp:Transcript_14072/g.18353  ORF Transcript_14072/g.18353 Transcript_14072/m.18353 type:complete len:321 (+) Transcript_14072:107-1069(+)|eukprot:CAMPEP_0198150234 /NCGR_PEP_ID=MMETSP1443-20131203/49981_1 /TAXON_ID=186043 /ORGANISM="Entomoneis sp., Strain CCMP2396" /LENGTH=320 /DNA_ID=CAMNT_0043815495 /DNA_START=112 /DNA_END=1074 /DNA_ORIENTATION=+
MGNLCSTDGASASGLPLKNSAFVFVKPHANTPATQKLVKEKLVEAGISILSELSIDGPTIDENKLIDQHYYAIASKATILPAKEIPVPPEKFQESFGESWEAVLSEDRAANAMEACKRFECDAAQLEEAWRAAEGGNKVVKFGGGFYCGLLTYNGQALYVFNAFFMSMRAKFVGADASIYCFEVEWDPTALSWADFRGKVLGPTDPAEAPDGALRKLILDTWQDLGLKDEPNKGDNGVHASASPFEGLAEKMNWLSKSLEQDVFGKALLDVGIPKDTLKAWSVDPRIKITADEQGSVFDTLEDLNVGDCLAKMKELNSLN